MWKRIKTKDYIFCSNVGQKRAIDAIEFMSPKMAHILLSLVIILFASIANSFHLHEAYQFPNGTWVENIAVQSSGNLLVTFASNPELWEVIPSAQPGATQARRLHHFPNAEMATGIAELEQDVYAVITPNTVWKVDLKNGTKKTPTRIATLQSARSLNGMAVLNSDTRTLAISDSEAGLVWRLDTNSGNYTVILRDETMAANTKEGVLLGINGLRVHNGHVYYVNTPERLFCRIPVNTTTGRATGPREIISQGALADDFAISRQGVGYLAGLTDHVITRVLANGTQEVIANSSALMSATSGAFGRLDGSDVLYITTGGETSHVVNNTSSRGGKVLALSLDP